MSIKFIANDSNGGSVYVGSTPVLNISSTGTVSLSSDISRRIIPSGGNMIISEAQARTFQANCGEFIERGAGFGGELLLDRYDVVHVYDGMEFDTTANKYVQRISTEMVEGGIYHVLTIFGGIGNSDITLRPNSNWSLGNCQSNGVRVAETAENSSTYIASPFRIGYDSGNGTIQSGLGTTHNNVLYSDLFGGFRGTHGMCEITICALTDCKSALFHGGDDFGVAHTHAMINEYTTRWKTIGDLKCQIVTNNGVDAWDQNNPNHYQKTYVRRIG